MTSEPRRFDVPRVGVAAVIRNREGKVVCGLRKGSHGSGTWQLPGGHLELGESFATCAEREVKEECGLDVRGTGVAAVTNDVFDAEGKHYITIFVKCDMVDEEAQPEVLEADKCDGWYWKTWEELRAEKHLFLPLVNLFEEHADVAALMR
ncbi:nudix domain-containing protein [Plectosphaerella cucumerina]|uniref:Nudix domain-containing protein n=1 Tax=Plectosphaerella cucumerina TaxID=40658 RepID=A0A8K0TRM0_9PEZI|nr:nudix domain-containing protein [Plectosphaerella cucumerina]